MLSTTGLQLRAVYDFVVDWDAFYIYDGVSADQIRKPHPDHDYLVVMDGYKSDPRETGGGWYGDGIQAIYHSRTHNDRFNSRSRRTPSTASSTSSVMRGASPTSMP